jgi:hypothetical protein
MELQYKKQSSCPSDETLFAYKRSGLTGEDHEEVTLHLLFCDACVEALNQLPSNREADAQHSDSASDIPRESIAVSPELAQVIERFRERETRRRERPLKTLLEVKQSGGLKIGQIWRTRFENVIVPTAETENSFSVTDLNSRPHLVVIINVSTSQINSRGDWHVIQVAPTSANTDYSSDADLVVDEKVSPLEYSFMIELWNQQLMLSENLDRCLGYFDEIQHKSIVEILRQQRKMDRQEPNMFSADAIIMKGLYHDPIKRFRMHEYEDTLYLRKPVESLYESTARDAVTEEQRLPYEAIQVQHSSERSFSKTRPAGFDDRHVSILSLVKLKLGTLDTTERSATVAHVEGCWQCERVMRSAWMKTIITGVEIGRRTIEQVQEVAEFALFKAGQIPAPSLDYARREEPKLPFAARFEQGTLTATLEETDGGELFVRISTRDVRLNDHIVHLEIVGETDTLQANLRLEKIGNYYQGVHYFEDYRDRITEFGTVVILAVPDVADTAP